MDLEKIDTSISYFLEGGRKMTPAESNISEKILKDAKKVKINKKEVKFHIEDNRIVFDEPISVQDGERIEMEIVLSADGIQVVNGVYICS